MAPNFRRQPQSTPIEPPAPSWSAYKSSSVGLGDVDLDDGPEITATTVVAETIEDDGEDEPPSPVTAGKPRFTAPSMPSLNAPKSLTRFALVGLGFGLARTLAAIHAATATGGLEITAFAAHGSWSQIASVGALLLVLRRASYSLGRTEARTEGQSMKKVLNAISAISGIASAATLSGIDSHLVLLPGATALLFISLWLESKHPGTNTGRFNLHTWIRLAFILASTNLLADWIANTLA